MEYHKLNHTTCTCKYQVVFIPKRRKKVIFGQLRIHLGELFHRLASQKDCEIVEDHLLRDHVHMCISIPPKYAVSQDPKYIPLLEAWEQVDYQKVRQKIRQVIRHLHRANG